MGRIWLQAHFGFLPLPVLQVPTFVEGGPNSGICTVHWTSAFPHHPSAHKEVLCDVPRHYVHQTTAQSLAALERRTTWDRLNTRIPASVTAKIWMPTTKVFPPLLNLFTSIAHSCGWWTSRQYAVWNVSHPFRLLQLVLMCISALSNQPQHLHTSAWQS